MENTIIDLAAPFDDLMIAITVPDPAALLARVQGRLDDPDIRDLATLVEKQVAALKTAKEALTMFIVEQAASALAGYLDERDETEPEKPGYD